MGPFNDQSPSTYNVNRVFQPGELARHEETALGVAENHGLNHRQYRAVERILAGDIDSAISFLQREKQARGAQL